MLKFNNFLSSKFVISAQSAAPAEFELLTWLVIKSESDNA
jgi:hypothetical protein